MRNVLLFAAFIIYSSASAQMYNEDYGYVQKQRIKKNKVRFVSSWTFNFTVTGELDKRGKKTSFERFDKNGNRLEEVYYDALGNSYFECTYTYDEKGTELSSIGFRPNKCIYNKWAYTVIDETRTVQKRPSKTYNNKEMWEYVFDKNMNRINESYYDSEGLLTSKKVFSYDDDGNILEKNEYDSYGTPFEKWEYTYDLKGNNTEQVHYNGNGIMFYKYLLRYDSKGNLSAKFLMDKDGNVKQLTVYLYTFYE